MKSTYKLGDIANISAGQGAPQKESDFSNIGKPFIRAGSLAKLVEGYSENNICELIDDDTAKKYGLRLYPKDTIVFAKSGMSTSKGYVHILSQECYIVNHLACINIYNNDSSYMKYYFMYHRPNKLIKDEAYPSISLSDIRDMKINIHNIQTQKEIVSVLDKVTSLIKMRKEQLEKLDILVKSKFIEMFGDNVIASQYSIKISDIALKIGDGLHGTPNYDETGIYAFINGNNLDNGKININKNTKFININEYNRLRKNISNNTILLSINGTLGKLAYYNSEEVALGKSVCYIDLKDSINRVFFYHALNSDIFQQYLENNANKSTIKNVNLEKIRNCNIFIPPLDIQNQFAEFVEHVEKNKENIKSSLNQLETLYSALMQEYFG